MATTGDGTRRGRWSVLAAAGLATAVVGCAGTVPSARLHREVTLPVPRAATELPRPERLAEEDHEGETHVLTARGLIPVAFERQPDIKSSYQRFKSEEARYDFFYASRDSLTPRLRVSNAIEEERFDKEVLRARDHTVELSVEKRFFDTTALNVGVGFETTDVEDDIGNAPFVSANLRYPLWASREKLERTSEDIFRQNELNDAQLAYIQTVRAQLRTAMFTFYEAIDLKRRLRYYDDWLSDLRHLQEQAVVLDLPTAGSDRVRIAAEISRVNAARRDPFSRFHVVLTRLKSQIGLPFYTRIDVLDEPFNPFVGQGHQALLRASIDTDPEIATLKNSVRNAEVQLDLARRGQWDIALLMGGSSDLEGRGTAEGASDWSVSFGLDVSAVDPRVTDSLTRQAQANIHRFQQAIAARENAIYADVFEPLIRIEILTESLEELLAALPRFVEDYESGVAEFLDGKLNVDDLLKRRETLFEQQTETSRFRFLNGANVAELCAATGKFFELLNDGAVREKP